MKGSLRVIEGLQMLLNFELAARDQYFIHSRIYNDMGMKAVYHRLNHEMEEETEHANQMIERMLFLEAIPDLNKRADVNVGSGVVEMLQNDLAVEYETISNLKTVVAICEEERDYDTRAILVNQLDDSEMDHAYWLEKQLRLIERIGLPNYIQSQMKSTESL